MVFNLNVQLLRTPEQFFLMLEQAPFFFKIIKKNSFNKKYFFYLSLDTFCNILYSLIFNKTSSSWYLKRLSRNLCCEINSQ